MGLQSVNHDPQKDCKIISNIYNENFHINDLSFIVDDIKKNIKDLSNFHWIWFILKNKIKDQSLINSTFFQNNFHSIIIHDIKIIPPLHLIYLNIR